MSTSHASSTVRRSAATAAFVPLALLLSGFRSPASAHEGEGILTLESHEPADDGSVIYSVRLAWDDDGHAPIDASVTATAIARAGTGTTPVPMQAVDQSGRYRATVELPGPGTWIVRFTAVTPAATLEVVEEVAAPTSTTAAPSEPTTSTADTTPSTQELAEDQISDDEDIGAGGIAAALFLAVVVVACAVGFYRSTKRLRANR